MEIADRLRQALDLHQRGDLVAAASTYQGIIADQPDHPDALHLLGVILKDIGQGKEAVRLISRAVELGRRDFSTLNNLALAHLSAGNGPEAERLLEQVSAAPGLSQSEEFGAALNLALTRVKTGNPLKGMRALAEALGAAGPLPADILLAAANLAQQADLDGARTTITALAVALFPGDVAAMFEHANAMLALGRLKEAATGFDIVTARFPDQGAQTQNAWANRLFLLNFLPATTNLDLYGAGRAWARTLPPSAPPPIRNRGDSKLRVGYLSDEFRTHHALSEIVPVLEAHDRTKLEVIALGDVVRPDAGTAIVETAADRYVALAAFNPSAKIAAIKSLGLDVLVGLTGYRADQKSLLANRLAPVQVIAVNNIATTGLETVDAHITDRWIDPEYMPEPRPATELLCRLAHGYSCYRPPEDAPPVTSRAGGPVRFGSFNNITKLTDETLTLWADLLRRCPESTLLIKAIGLSRPGIRRAYSARMAAAGLPMDRTTLLGADIAKADHMRHMLDVDIALDPIPFPGGASSREALWMGIPVVTRTGATWMSRVGASILGRIGLEELITADAESYLEAAAALAAQPERLADLRASLRDKMTVSPLLDAAGYTSELEELYATLLSGAG